MNFSKPAGLGRRALCLLAVLGLASALCGCQTMPRDDDDDSELPWNTPQAWEAAPGIPGLGGGAGGGSY